MARDQHNLHGVEFDGLRIIGKLGAGGMGDVWHAQDLDLDIPVAVKVLPPHLAEDQKFLIRFLREARAVAQLDHPNIVRVYQAGRRSWQGQDIRLIVMELVEGVDLHELRNQQLDRRIEAPLAARIILDCARALKFAHGKGVVHRDIKPANIMLSKDREVVKVLDFGLAKLGVQHRHTTNVTSLHDHQNESSPIEGEDATNQAIIGTPHYMSPEQARGKPADGRSDIYSLGITLYEVLTGTLPFDGGNIFSIISDHVLEELPVTEERFGDLPPFFRGLLKGMCEKDPRERLSLKQVIEELEYFLGVSKAADSTDAEVGQTRRTNLSRRPTRYIGRAQDALRLNTLFEEGAKLVTILGPAGVGKTRFAQEFGLNALGSIAEEVFFCDLTEARTIYGIAHEFGRVLSMPLTQRDPIEQIHNSLRCRREPTLLLVDNFEQVAHLADKSIGCWLQDSGQVRFLITSREPLHIEGEHFFPLSPLDCGSKEASGILEALEQQESGDPSDSPAFELFVDRAKAVRRDFVIDDETKKAIVGIVQELDGLPLAIELAAARIKMMSASRILDRLPARFELLASRRRDQSAKQQTLRAAIDWSWQLLKPYEQSALAQCSVFPCGFSLDAAEAVIDLAAFPGAPFQIDVIEALQEKSLLVGEEVEGMNGEFRYRMLESIRDYAGQRMSEIDRASSGEAALALRLRHAKFFTQHLPEWGRRVAQSPSTQTMRRMEVEIENVYAIQDALQSHEPLLVAKALSETVVMHFSRGPIAPLLPRLEQAIRALPKKERYLRLKLIVRLADGHAAFGSLDRGLAWIEEALQLASEIQADDPTREELLEIAEASSTQGRLLNFSGDGVAALQAFQRGYEVANRLQDPTKLGFAHRNLAEAYLKRGDFDSSIEHYNAAIANHQEAERFNDVAAWKNGMSTVYRRAGNLDLALQYNREAERLGREGGDMGSLAANVVARGNIHTALGELDKAIYCYQRAEAAYRAFGNLAMIASNVSNRGLILLEKGDMEEAEKVLLEAEKATRDAGYVPLLGYILTGLTLHTIRRDPKEVSIPQAELALKRAVECLEVRENLGIQDSTTFFKTLALRAYAEYRLANLLDDHLLLESSRKHADNAKQRGESIGVERGDEGEILEEWQWLDEILSV